MPSHSFPHGVELKDNRTGLMRKNDPGFTFKRHFVDIEALRYAVLQRPIFRWQQINADKLHCKFLLSCCVWLHETCGLRQLIFNVRHQNIRRNNLSFGSRLFYGVLLGLNK